MSSAQLSSFIISSTPVVVVLEGAKSPRRLRGSRCMREGERERGKGESERERAHRDIAVM